MCWNLAIVAAFYPLIQLVEVALRNALHHVASSKYQGANNGNDRLALWVAGFNTNAQGFYHHIGFHETGLTQTEDMGPELEMINY